MPVIRDVDKKDLLQLSKDMQELAEKARDRKISLEEMKGGTFTISNQGGIGGAHFTPIINKPEVAILGLGRGALKPVVRRQKNRAALDDADWTFLRPSRHRWRRGGAFHGGTGESVSKISDEEEVKDLSSMEPIKTEIVVIGAGPGGYAAAFYAADKAKKSFSSSRTNVSAAFASIAVAFLPKRCCTPRK